MNALIIGAGGFVGRYLIRKLNEDGYEVCATKLPFEKITCDGCHVTDLDIADRDAIADVLQNTKPDVIFHLAALSSVMLSWKNIAKTFEVNTLGAVNLLDSVREYSPAAKVLLIGSGEEYGITPQTAMPICEESPVNPGNPYAISKLSQTCLGRMYVKAFHLDIVMMRAFNHSGPFQPEGFVIPDLCRQIVAIERGEMDNCIRTGNLNAKRDFTDVRDIVAGYSACARTGRSGEIYNIGSGHAVGIDQILQTLCSFSTANIRVETDPEKLRPIDIPLIEADIRKIAADTGWSPKISLQKSLEDTLQYWRNKTEWEKAT